MNRKKLMVSGYQLLEPAQRTVYEEYDLDRFKREEVHDKIIFESKYCLENDMEEDAGMDEIEPSLWKVWAGKQTVHIAEHEVFIRLCKDLNIDPFGEKAEKYAELVTLKQAENGD